MNSRFKRGGDPDFRGVVLVCGGGVRWGGMSQTASPMSRLAALGTGFRTAVAVITRIG